MKNWKTEKHSPRKCKWKCEFLPTISRDTQSSIFQAVSLGFASVNQPKNISQNPEGWQKAKTNGKFLARPDKKKEKKKWAKSKTNKQTDINFIDIMNKIAACRKCLIWRHWNGSGAHSTVEIWHCSRKNNGYMFSFALLPLVCGFFSAFFSVTDSESQKASTAGWHFMGLTFGTLKANQNWNAVP